MATWKAPVVRDTGCPRYIVKQVVKATWFLWGVILIGKNPACGPEIWVRVPSPRMQNKPAGYLIEIHY